MNNIAIIKACRARRHAAPLNSLELMQTLKNLGLPHSYKSINKFVEQGMIKHIKHSHQYEFV